MSLAPRPGRKKGQTSSDMRVGMRLITGDPEQDNFTFSELRRLNNPIITQYIIELEAQPRPRGMNKLRQSEGIELLKRLGKL